MNDKLPIAQVRKELRMLKIELDHLMITRTIHRTYLNEELHNPRVAEVEARIKYLESEYPNWEQAPRSH